MPATRTYTNDDLIPSYAGESKSRVWTNKDLRQERHPPDIMDDDMEDSPPDILDDELTPSTPISTAQPISPNEPDTFWGGVLNSFRPGGEVEQTTNKSLLGYAKGAVLDIPSAAWEGAKSAFNFAKDIAPIPGNNPIEAIASRLANIPSAIQGMGEIAGQSGSDPEAFGRMMGNMTGQGIVTAGIAKGIPPTIRAAGMPIEAAGGFMRRHAPITGMPGGFVLGRNGIKIERAVGRGLENIGKRMRTKTVDGVTIKYDPDIPENEIVKAVKQEREIPQSEGQLSKVADAVVNKPKFAEKVRVNRDGTFTDMATGEVFDSKGRSIAEVTKEPPILDLYPGDAASKLITEGKKLANKKYPPEIPKEYHPAPDWPEGTKLDRLNELRDKSRNGTLTGEELVEARVLDKQLRNNDINPINPNLPKPLPKKSVTIENAPPNQRAKIMRGMNDAVDVLFVDSNSREMFGAGQSLFSASKTPNPALVQRFIDSTERVAKTHNISIEAARKAVIEYNRKIKDMSKEMPKYGEDLNFKAPSFEEFLKSDTP